MINVVLTYKQSQMDKLIFLFFIATMFYSCRTKEPVKVNPEIDSANAVVKKADSSDVIKDTHYFWISELDQEHGLVMKKSEPIQLASLSAANMIERINKEYPEIRLRYTRVSNDTIFVKIKKSAYLTESMGSSGAEAYLAEVTYNLTELKGINAVDIRFKAGDHATPDTYSRTDFVNKAHK